MSGGTSGIYAVDGDWGATRRSALGRNRVGLEQVAIIVIPISE